MSARLAYPLAILSAIGALGLAFLLHPVVGNAAVLLFVVGVTATALFAGLRPALASTFASLLLIDYFLLLPTYTLDVVAEADIALLILFVLVATATSWMAERVRKAREVADQTATRAAAIASLLERQLTETEQQSATLHLINTVATARYRSRD